MVKAVTENGSAAATATAEGCLDGSEAVAVRGASETGKVEDPPGDMVVSLMLVMVEGLV